ALLLPSWLRPISSPCNSIGMPCDRNNVARKSRCWRLRSESTLGSSVGPSTPQFHERLSPEPSRLSSPFFSLCLSLYDTRPVDVVERARQCCGEVESEAVDVHLDDPVAQ